MVSPWIFTVIMKVVVFVKAANIILRASIVISAERSSIDHTKGSGMKQTYAKVIIYPILNLNFYLIIIFFTACDCDNFYSTGNCAEGSGKCECKPAYQEPDCRTCSYGYFGYPECEPCRCNLNGTEGYHCEPIHGICPCKPNFSGDYCTKCADGYYNYPECTPCECDHPGSINDVCNFETGQCECSSQFDGQQCERCKHGYFNYPECRCMSMFNLHIEFQIMNMISFISHLVRL